MDDNINSVEEINAHPSAGKNSGFKFSPVAAVIVLIVVIAAGLFFFLKQNKTSTVGTNSSSNSSTTSDTSTKSITLAEIATHKDATSCWMAIEGNVYDVTAFIPNHPGGDQILLGCGKNATEMFNSRPNDGTSHSNRARQMLAQFAIGVLSK